MQIKSRRERCKRTAGAQTPQKSKASEGVASAFISEQPQRSDDF